MAEYQFLVLSNPISGQEQEFNRWYDEEHIPSILTVEGMKAAIRYKRAIDLDDNGGWEYVVVYHMETDDLPGLIGRIEAAAAAGTISTSPALDLPNAVRGIYKKMG
ncbi:hypothetical protein KFK14_07080 [Sphingobium phenoxybenzoativorans]|uniref:DUF4286 family protein n=1 Tax=Sphingobium phenoxybenzoativorans TaxID=1592790 RepID=A0A975K9A4_9SPHN|nr:DUF4286 family protein [Sphingobium phenoxybenzoativorans]QUT07171.1 hypothetical protein KFK14_07080 [Sphingobium phenoxybenzoativorans]